MTNFKNFNYNDFYSLESEQFILSSLIVYNNSWNDIYTFLTIDSFYFKNHKIIFSIILDFLNLNLYFDVYSIYNKLKYNYDFDFLNYLNFLIQKLPNPSNILFYTSIIHNTFILRKIFFFIDDFLNNILCSENIDILSLLTFVESNIFEINKFYISEKNDLNWMGDIFIKYFNDSSLIKDSLFFTGFKDLDDLLLGIHRGDFIIIAGRPSMGKTAFSLNIANYVSKNYNYPVIIFSMEMSIQQLFIRILSLILDIDQNVLFDKLNNLSDLSFDLHSKIYSSKIFIDETSNLSILHVYSKCKFLIKEYGSISLVIIDYLQLITSSSNFNQNRVFEVSEISRSLKCLAKELNVPVIAISQLNRNLELRNNKRPTISDLRESGSIEQDADIILFIYRDEVYNIQNEDNKNIAEIIISKHRNGSLGKILLKFFAKKSKFIDFE